MISLLDASDDYEAILGFARSARASALALLLRRVHCSELTLTPFWRLPSNDTLELRLDACDGSLKCCKHTATRDGVSCFPVINVDTLEALLPRAAARAFAMALEAEPLRRTIAAHLELAPAL